MSCVEEFIHDRNATIREPGWLQQQSTAARRVREAHFPEVKCFDQLDWDALSGVSRPKLRELASCAYVEAGDDVVLAGPIGTGKTHLAIALGVEAARQRYRVAFVRARRSSSPIYSSKKVVRITLFHHGACIALCVDVSAAVHACLPAWRPLGRHHHN
jgi:DNA replication protein DnaC